MTLNDIKAEIAKQPKNAKRLRVVFTKGTGEKVVCISAVKFAPEAIDHPSFIEAINGAIPRSDAFSVEDISAYPALW